MKRQVKAKFKVGQRVINTQLAIEYGAVSRKYRATVTKVYRLSEGLVSVRLHRHKSSETWHVSFWRPLTAKEARR